MRREGSELYIEGGTVAMVFSMARRTGGRKPGAARGGRGGGGVLEWVLQTLCGLEKLKRTGNRSTI